VDSGLPRARPRASHRRHPNLGARHLRGRSSDTLGLAARGRDAPPQILRIVIACLAVALLFAQFHTFNGIKAGSSLLALMAGLKLLETRNNRDVCVIILIVYFPES
jgi:hypothetical protein